MTEEMKACRAACDAWLDSLPDHTRRRIGHDIGELIAIKGFVAGFQRALSAHYTILKKDSKP